MVDINIITLALVLVFFIPIIDGVIKSYSRERIEYSISSLFESIEFLACFLASVYLTKRIFFENNTKFFKWVYDAIPSNIKVMLKGQDILTYLVFVPVILLLLLIILRPITNLIYRYVLAPLSLGIYNWMNSLGRFKRKFLIGMYQVPRAVFCLVVFAIMLNFFGYFYSSPNMSKWMNQSTAYQFLYKNAVYPILNSNIAKKVPVIVNDSFRKTVGRVVPNGNGIGEVLPEALSGDGKSKGNSNVIEYFNGVTLDEAVKSDAQIDKKAVEIVGNEKDGKKEANLLYKWISRNIKYDYDKAQRLGTNPRGISSGSIIAFDTRKGVCFDYSCLYVSMCRAVGLKVRLITGLGYSGVSWGDHAWNQVYYPAEKRWINVDTTFGTANNYFDKSDFNVDHRDAEIQGEW